MGNLQRKISETTDIVRGVTALLLLAAFYGICILGAFCILAGAVAYASCRLKLETGAQSSTRRLPFTRSEA
jgi:hypothetical protein